MSLLDDLEDDYTQHLLANGNLSPKKEKPPELISKYVSQGYIARVQENRCACGAAHKVFHGVFLRKESTSGAIFDEALSTKGLQVPLDQNYPLYITVFPVHVCPSCLPFKGFKEVYV